MATRCRIATSGWLLTALILLSGCWQRQRVVGDPRCAQLPIVRGQNREWKPRQHEDANYRLVGQVVRRLGDSALASALVRIRTEHDSLQIQTGADGLFRAALPRDSVVRVDIRRVGYEYVLIPALHVKPDSLLLVPMQQQPLDGECSDNYVVVTRRPWWHIW